jgi:hypothetical protein
MPRYADAEIAVSALNTKRNIETERLRVFRAEVTAVTSGLVSIQRGSDTDDEDAGYPCVVPGIPDVGDEVVAVMLGGAPVILGILGNAATNQPRIGTTLTKIDSSSAAPVSTTSDATWATLRTLTWSTIPDGTYDIAVSWDGQFSDTVSAQLNYRANIGAGTGTSFTMAMSTARERVAFTQEAAGVVVTGGLTVVLQFKRNTGASAGTASGRNPRMTVFAMRTGV